VNTSLARLAVYGKLRPPFDKIGTYALACLELSVAKRHKKPRTYGLAERAYQSPSRLA
jgi:hypothetical protein